MQYVRRTLLQRNVNEPKNYKNIKKNIKNSTKHTEYHLNLNKHRLIKQFSFYTVRIQH